MVIVTVFSCAAAQFNGIDGIISVNAGLLSARVGDVALEDVLRKVGEEAGVKVRIEGKLGKVQPQTLSDVPLREALTRLTQHSDADLVLVFQRDAAGQRCLTEIRAYERIPSQKIDRPPPPPRIPTPAPPPMQ